MLAIIGYHIEPFNYTIKSICFDFCSTNVGSSVIKTCRSEGSLLLYFYRFRCHYPLITYLISRYMQQGHIFFNLQKTDGHIFVHSQPKNKWSDKKQSVIAQQRNEEKNPKHRLCMPKLFPSVFIYLML